MDKDESPADQIQSTMVGIQSAVDQLRVGVIAAQTTAIAEVAGGVLKGIEPVSEFVQQGLAFQASMRAPLEFARFSEAITEVMKRQTRALERAEIFGAFGWTVPMHATLSQYEELIEKITGPESADAAFTEFYASNPASLAELKDQLLNNDKLKRWAAVLEEAIQDLEDGRLRSCIALTLPLVERTIATTFSAPHFQKQAEREKFFGEKLRATPPDSMDRYIWRSLKGFTEVVFKFVDFKGPASEPAILNRHWLLHGRGIVSPNLSDCLRLLQALDTIVCLD